MPLRIVFCGTPAFALPSLRRFIADSDFTVEAVVTQPDRPRGRGGHSSSSPVKEAALEAGLHVYQPEKIRSDSSFEFFQRLAPDAVVIIAYGQIVPPPLIAVPRLGWINLHGSLLPKYRGAAPINWVILDGQTRTGLTTMQIDAGLDTGPVLLKTEIDIRSDETAPELAARMADAGAPLVAETLRRFSRGEISPLPQDSSLATHARPLKKEDGQIDWSLAAPHIYNRIRGLQPWPGAFTAFRGRLCHIWGRPAGIAPGGSESAAANGRPAGTLLLHARELFVRCGETSFLKIEQLQLEGRKRISAAEFLNGARLHAGEKFGT